MTGFDWNDVRMLLAVARHGSTLTASRHLKTSQTTVMRRIAALEEALKVPLVERRQSGYRLTETALTMLPDFKALEAAAERIATGAEASRRSVSGVVRLATHELIANLTLPSALKEFRAKYPDITVEVLSSDARADLEKGEADVAIRSGPRPSEPGLVARLLGEGDWGVFASPAYVAEHGRPTTPDELTGHVVIAGDGAWGRMIDDWLAQNGVKVTTPFRTSSLLGAVAQVRQGLGVGFLPHQVFRQDPDLVWCFTPPQEKSQTWLVTHERLRKVARIRALLDFIVAYNNAAKARAPLSAL